MADQSNLPTTEVHVSQPDQQVHTVVLGGETNLTNPTETHLHQIEKTTDPLADVTHRLEDVHVTVNHEPVVAVEPTVSEKAAEFKQDANHAAANVQEKAADVAHNVQDQAAEFKHDAAVVAHDVQDKAKEVSHDVQEKVSEAAANTKEALVDAKETVSEKASELADSAKDTAHDANVKAQELKASAGEKLETAEKIGEQRAEESKQWLNEKGSEVKAKGAGILDATQHALAAGAAKVTEKAKHGIELASEAAHHAQAKAAAAADVIAAKAVEAKKSTVAAAHNAASTVQEKTSALVDSSKHALASSPPATADHVTQEAYVTKTSAQTVHGEEPVLAEQPPAKPPKTRKGGAISSIRKFFARIFNSSRRSRESKVNQPEVPQTTEIVTTTTSTVATTNPPHLS